MRKGASGIKTVIILLLLAALTIFGIYKLTQTDMFNPNREYILREASEASITDFQKSCLIYTEKMLEENEKDLKDAPIYYRGKIDDIKESPFGDSEVLIRVIGSKYEVGDNTRVLVKISDAAYLRANEGDTVDVYGKFSSLDKKESKTIINVAGVRIIEAQTDY